MRKTPRNKPEKKDLSVYILEVMKKAIGSVQKDTPVMCSLSLQ